MKYSVYYKWPHIMSFSQINFIHLSDLRLVLSLNYLIPSVLVYTTFPWSFVSHYCFKIVHISINFDVFIKIQNREVGRIKNRSQMGKWDSCFHITSIKPLLICMASLHDKFILVRCWICYINHISTQVRMWIGINRSL